MWQLCPCSELLQGPDRNHSSLRTASAAPVPPADVRFRARGTLAALRLQASTCSQQRLGTTSQASHALGALPGGCSLHFMLPEQCRGVTHDPPRVCNQEEKCFNATSPSNKPGTFSMLREWRFGAFSCISTQAQPCALRKRTCPCRIPALLDGSTPLPGTTAALAPVTRARIQHSREKCKPSYSAFAAQLGLKSPANSPNPA